MYNIIKYEEIVSNEDYILIDVRSPSEYESAHIPQAINIPLFSNEERALVGTIYKQDSVENARIKGIEIVSSKLPNLYNEFLQIINANKHIVLYCSRGGYRSSSLFAFINSIGHKAYKLDGGYKAYRAYINQNLPKLVDQVDFVILYGNTGVGKTHILEELTNLNLDVLDLEYAANHRGSTLGAVGLGQPNSQKMFESLIFDQLKNRKSNLVFLEGESRKIGRSSIPNYIFEKMDMSRNILVQSPIEFRVENLMEDYLHDQNQFEELDNALNYLRKFLGNEKIDNYHQLIANGQYELLAKDLMVNYYDINYNKRDKDYLLKLNNTNHEETAKKIYDFFAKEIAKD